MSDGLSSESQVEYAETDTVVELQNEARRHLEAGDREAATETLVKLRFIVDTGRSPDAMTDEERQSIREELQEDVGEFDDIDQLGTAIEQIDPDTT